MIALALIASAHLTLFQQNLAFVQEERPAEETITDLPSQILPESIEVNADVLEQTFEQGAINREALLRQVIGQEIDLVDWNKEQDRVLVTRATVLSEQGIYEIEGDIYLGHPGTPVLPEGIQGLTTKPTLRLTYQKKPKEVELYYLTQGIGWNANYTLVQQDDKTARLTCMASVSNRSGKTYRDSSLNLIAGTPNQVGGGAQEGIGIRAMKMADTEMVEQPFGGYHLYRLGREVTLEKGKTKKLPLLTVDPLPYETQYLVQGNNAYHTRAYGANRLRIPVQMKLKLPGIDQPLPAGKVRILKATPYGEMTFIGEDHLPATPEGEEAMLTIGEAFDVVAERKQTDYKRHSSKLHESTWEITLRNRQENPVNVRVIEPLYGNWKVTSHSHAYEKLDANRVAFDVNVEDEVRITYTVQVGI